MLKVGGGSDISILKGWDTQKGGLKIKEGIPMSVVCGNRKFPVNKIIMPDNSF